MNHFTAIELPSAQALLDDYHSQHPFFFASPEQTLLAQGHYASVPAADNLLALSEAVSTALKQARENGHPHPIVVGAIPFDSDQAACLTIPQVVLKAGRLPPQAWSDAGALNYRITAEPAPQVYADGVAAAVARLKEQQLSKVVLARTLNLSADQDINVGYLLQRIVSANTQGYTFAVNLDASEQGTLIGGSPELLLSRNGAQIRSMPLAGSAARTVQDDAATAAALLQSGKDLHEHQVVADAVAAGLRPFCTSLTVPASPSLLSTATMWHLASDIRGQLADLSMSALHLAAHLHPTPAVCGYPNQAARDLIAEIEPFERGFYTGMVGWCDEFGNGEWIVTIRCATVKEKQLRLFAGAGIVADSQPHSELAETTAKFKTMLNALGVAHEGVL